MGTGGGGGGAAGRLEGWQALNKLAASSNLPPQRGRKNVNGNTGGYRSEREINIM
jgi:hypothetical protein